MYGNVTSLDNLLFVAGFFLPPIVTVFVGTMFLRFVMSKFKSHKLNPEHSDNLIKPSNEKTGNLSTVFTKKYHVSQFNYHLKNLITVFGGYIALMMVFIYINQEYLFRPILPRTSLDVIFFIFGMSAVTLPFLIVVYIILEAYDFIKNKNKVKIPQVS